MEYIPYHLEPAEFPGLYKTRPFGTSPLPFQDERIQSQVNTTVEFAEYILEARRNLIPNT